MRLIGDESYRSEMPYFFKNIHLIENEEENAAVPKNIKLI